MSGSCPCNPASDHHAAVRLCSHYRHPASQPITGQICKARTCSANEKRFVAVTCWSTSQTSKQTSMLVGKISSREGAAERENVGGGRGGEVNDQICRRKSSPRSAGTVATPAWQQQSALTNQLQGQTVGQPEHHQRHILKELKTSWG